MLIAGALSLSLVANIYVGRNLIVDDKITYIYDHTLTRVKAASESLENKVMRFVKICSTHGSFYWQR